MRVTRQPWSEACSLGLPHLSWMVWKPPLRYIVSLGVKTFKDTGLQKKKSCVSLKPSVLQGASQSFSQQVGPLATTLGPKGTLSTTRLPGPLHPLTQHYLTFTTSAADVICHSLFTILSFTTCQRLQERSRSSTPLLLIILPK